MSHDARCEHSKTKRCRCDCHGAQHGIHAPLPQLGTHTIQAPGLLYPSLGEDLKRAGQQLAAYNEAMFAESGVRV